MVLAKGAGTNPRALAELIAPKLEALPAVTAVEIAGPGFINLRLARRRLARRAGDDPAPRASATACRRSATTSGSMSNMSRPTRPGRCTWAIAAARWSATRWPGCSRRRASGSPRNIMSTTPAAQVDTLARSAAPALPRGARRGHRRDPRRALPGRLSEAGRSAARRRISATNTSTRPRANGSQLFKQRDGRGDARPDPPRPRPARHPPRHVRVRGRAAGVGQGRGGDGQSARQGAGLSRASSSGPRASTRTTNGSRSS